MSDSDSQELKTNYISLWKNWAALKAEHELEDYKEYLPDNTDLFSLKSVEDAILKLAGAYESEEDEYALAYKLTTVNLKGITAMRQRTLL